MKNQNYKYQHFVPKFYLKNFSNNSKSIGSFIFAIHKYVEFASISNICGRDYFYGDDLKLEHWFQDLEATWSPIIRKIIKEKNLECITNEELAYLIIFIFLSDVRTGYVADSIIDEVTEYYRLVAKILREHGRMQATDEQINKIQAKVDKPTLAYLQNIDELTQIMADLKLILIHNTSSKHFITSDRPVAKYNLFFVENRYFRPYGYGHQGLKIFLPISPELCLVLFDEEVYSVKYDEKCVLRINAPDQIMAINKLFVENSRAAIYFNNKDPKWVVERMAANKKDMSQKFNKRILGDAKHGYFSYHALDCVYKKIAMPRFIVKEEFLKMPLTGDGRGPIRPWVEHLEKNRKNNSSE